MNKEETKKAIEVMQAYVDGKEIEVINRKCVDFHTTTLYPNWDWILFDYRVKPEPREWEMWEFPGSGVLNRDHGFMCDAAALKYGYEKIKVREVLDKS